MLEKNSAKWVIPSVIHPIFYWDPTMCQLYARSLVTCWHLCPQSLIPSPLDQEVLASSAYFQPNETLPCCAMKPQSSLWCQHFMSQVVEFSEIGAIFKFCPPIKCLIGDKLQCLLYGQRRTNHLVTHSTNIHQVLIMCWEGTMDLGKNEKGKFSTLKKTDNKDVNK